VRRFGCLLAVAMYLSSATVQAAGLCLIEVPANESDRALTGAVSYPCSAPTHDIAIESRVITAAEDCSILGNKLPLIVTSHGRTGWFGGHYSTAATIADAGFVVAAISHPGDNTADKSRVDDLSALLSDLMTLGG
jgi:predicted dienelactone hydrolase